MKNEEIEGHQVAIKAIKKLTAHHKSWIKINGKLIENHVRQIQKLNREDLK